MRITRLLLRHYRVYEELDLELPPGLVGLYGPNGAGKTVLLESIQWALYGKARTNKDEIRTTGVNADCVAEVEFEHDGHLYVVRRTITGVNHTVKAEARADGQQVAEGVRDTDKYVRSILGMDEAAFRSSVFAEQKQLDAFSSKKPAERQKLVLRLLGITPLDTARDDARKDSRHRQQDYERLRSLLPDVDELRTTLADHQAQAAAAAAALSGAQEASVVADEARTAADDRHAKLLVLKHEHDALVAEGTAVRKEHDDAAHRVEQLERELADLGDAEQALGRLQPDAEGAEDAARRLQAIEVIDKARSALDHIPALEAPPEPDPAPAEAARTAAERLAGEQAELDGRLKAALAERDRATELARKADDLSDAGDCPLCGQALGAAFERVQAHRVDDVRRAGDLVAELERRRVDVAAAVDGARSEARAHAAALRHAQEAWSTYSVAAERRRTLEQTLADATAAVHPAPERGEAARLRADVERMRKAAAECARLRGRLERRPAAEADLDSTRARLHNAAGRLEALREKRRSLAFDPQQLRSAEEALLAATTTANHARAKLAEAASSAATLRERAQQTAARLDDALSQHAKLAEVGDEARHLARLAELLHAFRNTLVSAAGPRLSAQAAELFAALTDHEYDGLKVDGDTYEIQITDQGRVHALDRFSGSETDLANLALRVAISEHVRFQSGGQVGLLVLDEAFGSLDDDRRGRLVLVLERLRARFRQIIVVTHSNEVKEQLPQAIEVVKLGERRATARPVGP